MNKNLELATKVLEKVENELESKDFKAVKVLLQAYRKQLENTFINISTLESFRSEEWDTVSNHNKKLNELTKLAQTHFDEMVESDDYHSMNALTLIIGDLQLGKDKLSFD